MSADIVGPSEGRNRPRAGRPVETKDPLPLAALKAAQGHISDAVSEGDRGKVLVMEKKLERLKKVLERNKDAKMRKMQERWKQEDARHGEESDGNDFIDFRNMRPEDKEKYWKEIQERRKLRRAARKATAKMVEEKLAHQALSGGGSF